MAERKAVTAQGWDADGNLPPAAADAGTRAELAAALAPLQVQVERGELVITRTLLITRTQLRAAPRHVRGRRGLVPVVDAER